MRGLEGKCAIGAAGKSKQDEVVAELAEFGEDVEAIAGAVADAVQIEEDGLEVGEFEDGFDGVFGGGQGGAKLRGEELADIGEKVGVVGNDGQGVAFWVESRFGQWTSIRYGVEIIGEAGREVKEVEEVRGVKEAKKKRSLRRALVGPTRA